MKCVLDDDEKKTFALNVTIFHFLFKRRSFVQISLETLFRHDFLVLSKELMSRIVSREY